MTPRPLEVRIPRAAAYRSWLGLALTLVLLAGRVTPAAARPDKAMLDDFKLAYPELFQNPKDGSLRTADVPDIFGPGAVLNVGKLHMKITNFDIIGNPFFGLSSDPSAQWPGASGIEYLSFMLLAVGGVDKTATDPAAVRRVSMQPEWRPPTLAAEDRMYKSFDGKVFGQRLVDDDLDANNKDPLDRAQFVDEDFLDGRDNDGDGQIDEDYGAIGQLMWSCTMLDDTPQALAAAANEKHVPLHLELRQVAFAFSVPGFEDFNAINWTIINRSGHPIDSMYVGLRYDVDAGPADSPTYFTDDIDVPFFPHGDFTVVLSGDDKWGQKMDPKGYRRQLPHATISSLNPDSASLPLCQRVTLRVNGVSVVDDEGDAGRTPGIASLLLLGHTTDPMGLMAPRRVGWTQFRTHLAGTPFASGGTPVVDQQRMDMFVSGENIDPETGFITATPVDQAGDIQGFGSIGPFGATDDQGRAHPIPDGGSIEVTMAFAVNYPDAAHHGGAAAVSQYPSDYQKYLAGALTANDLFAEYPQLENAFAAQVAYEGVYDDPPSVLNDPEHINIPDFHGRETRLRAAAGFILSDEDCRQEGARRQIDEFHYTWFDFDCDFCSGVWVFGTGPDFGDGPGSGKMLKRWNTAAPPPNPEVNTSASQNFSDNPGRIVAPGQDGLVRVAWDNLPEISKDPESGNFDFRSYRLWKVSDWRRPTGTTGPSDEEWRLLAHYRYFDYFDGNREKFAPDKMTARGFHASAFDTVAGGTEVCPQIFIPNLSVQTVVFAQSDFPTAQSVQAWLGSAEAEDQRIRPIVAGSGGFQADRLSQAGSVWRYQIGDGVCKPNSFHTVGLRGSTVWAEVCLNPLAVSRGFTVPICLNKGDLWDPQSGDVLRPVPGNCPNRAPDGTCLADTIPCVKAPSGDCEVQSARAVGQPPAPISRTRYPVGRYRYDDLEVKNGFLYFYSVTAGDSVGNTELTGRRSGVEADAVFPQLSTQPAGNVWVVPNPYRGYPQIARRPSSWDLEPNATDPTGTHLDFLGMPPGPWTIQIFTVSGDLVQVLHSDDAINDSVRGPTSVPNPGYNPALGDDPVNNPRTITLPGFNRQQDNANDGQARWNLISRNGQDVVSGVYIFVVESQGNTQRGKFVVIR